MANWIKACAVDDIDEEDVIRFDHGERTFAIYRTEGGIYATDGQLHPRTAAFGGWPGHR